MAGDSHSDGLPRQDSVRPDQRAAALADRYWRENRYGEALAQYQAAVRAAPEQAQYRLQLGQCAWMLKQFEAAETELHRACELSPDHPPVHKVLAEFCLSQGRMERALFHSARAFELSPRDPDIIVMRASILHENSQTADAWRLIEPLLRSGVCSLPLAVLFARLAPYVKHETAALSVVNHLLSVPTLSQHAAVRLHFAAASLLDRAGRFDEAFRHARAGKERRRPDYEPAQTSELIDRQIAYFTREKLRTLPRATPRDRRPVFIIGMPRSGTSLVEQILASHRQVHGAGELRTLPQIHDFAQTSSWAHGKLYPELLDALTATIADELAGQYLSAISLLDSGATFVTDKMPDNFLLLGLIATLLPHSRVIHCTRDPRDTCLSCYMNYFAGRQPYSHELEHLGAYYRDYERLMTHWKAVLDVPMIEVNYESLVADLPGQARHLLAWLGLPWDEECLRFYNSKRPVLTPSCDQVRRPLYSSSVGRWKNYTRQLSPLIAALGSKADSTGSFNADVNGEAPQIPLAADATH